jgi:hypothetical protein
MTEQFRLDRAIAEEWWRDHRPGGYFHSGSSPEAFGDEESDRAASVASFIQDRACDPETLGQVLTLFAATAQDGDELAFVGTTHLEDAYFVAPADGAGLGDRALEILHSSGLSPETVTGILRGFQP